MKVSVHIRDAKTGGEGIPDKGRWVDGELLSGDIPELSNPKSTEGVTVKLNRAYLISGKVIEKENIEKFYYKKEIKRRK